MDICIKLIVSLFSCFFLVFGFFVFDTQQRMLGLMLLLVYAQCHPVDDVFYPKNLLKFWSQNGIDITGLDAIPGRFQVTESK